MTRVATLLGGPRDGKLVKVQGPMLYEPVLSLAGYVPESVSPLPSRLMTVRAYDLRLTVDGQFVYVIRSRG